MRRFDTAHPFVWAWVFVFACTWGLAALIALIVSICG